MLHSIYYEEEKQNAPSSKEMTEITNANRQTEIIADIFDKFANEQNCKLIVSEKPRFIDRLPLGRFNANATMSDEKKALLSERSRQTIEKLEILHSQAALPEGMTVDADYIACIEDIIDNDLVRSMDNIPHHSYSTCLEHSFCVSYNSFRVCKLLGLDWRSAARGGLLHDFFLYDWHLGHPAEGIHGFVHPRIALKNARKYFDLNSREEDMIVRHMWPVTIIPPKYPESYVIIVEDKYCAVAESFRAGQRRNISRLRWMMNDVCLEY